VISVMLLDINSKVNGTRATDKEIAPTDGQDDEDSNQSNSFNQSSYNILSNTGVLVSALSRPDEVYGIGYSYTGIRIDSNVNGPLCGPASGIVGERRGEVLAQTKSWFHHSRKDAESQSSVGRGPV